jgi:hypothetical protein
MEMHSSRNEDAIYAQVTAETAGDFAQDSGLRREA